MSEINYSLVFKSAVEVIGFLSNAFTVATSFLVFYLYFTKKNEIATAFRLFLNFSYQTTLAELKWKLDRLNEFRVDEPSHINEIKSLLHDIAGQIKGNYKLNEAAPDLVKILEKFADSVMTEPRKRSIVSLVREKIKTISVNGFEEIIRS